jgi:hypothetical protein
MEAVIVRGDVSIYQQIRNRLVTDVSVVSDLISNPAF